MNGKATDALHKAGDEIVGNEISIARESIRRTDIENDTQGTSLLGGR